MDLWFLGFKFRISEFLSFSFLPPTGGSYFSPLIFNFGVFWVWGFLVSVGITKKRMRDRLRTINHYSSGVVDVFLTRRVMVSFPSVFVSLSTCFRVSRGSEVRTFLSLT